MGSAAIVIDGDEVRQELCRDLGFSKADRDENVRRIGYLSRLSNRHGLHAIVAAISPYREARDRVKNECPLFLEVHVDCAFETLVRRDVKGLYRQALAGKIPHFTGVSDPYEAPLGPDVYVDSSRESVKESLSRLVSKLQDLGWLGHLQDQPSSEDAKREHVGIKPVIPAVPVLDRSLLSVSRQLR